MVDRYKFLGKRAVLFLFFWGLWVMIGCGTKTTVLLLPEPDGSVGSVTVLGQDQSSEILETAYQSAEIGKPGQRVRKGDIFSKDKVQETFGEALAIQPLVPEVFILYFERGGTELTDASKAMIPDILESILLRKSKDVAVVGHTDRVGEAEKNRILSMERAQFVVDFLIENGVEEEVIEASSHGESNPVVPTEDEVDEPKNRRVEVMIR